MSTCAGMWQFNATNSILVVLACWHLTLPNSGYDRRGNMRRLRQTKLKWMRIYEDESYFENLIQVRMIVPAMERLCGMVFGVCER